MAVFALTEGWQWKPISARVPGDKVTPSRQSDQPGVRSAVEVQVLSCDEGRQRAEKVCAGGSEFLRPTESAGRLRIVVEDSGAGFAWQTVLAGIHDVGALSGRGIPLVNSLCESLRYEGRGNRVEAVYVWDG